MGFFSALRLGSAAADLTAAADTTATPRPQIASPWVPYPSHLESVVWADVFGEAAPPTRAAAIALPALARQRHLICGTIARLPLRVIDGPKDSELEEQPGWTSRTDGLLSPYHRMLWTIDDLIFYGWSLWRAHRGSEGQLLAADRVAFERWGTDQAGRLLIDGEYVNDSRSVILIPGPHEGILSFGAHVIRQATANADAAGNAARNPSAYLELHYTGDQPLTDPEIDSTVTRWAAARRGEHGGVAFTGKNLEVREHGTHGEHLLIEGRNADAVDLSRLVSSPAAMADATTSGASLTYETTEGRNGEFIDYGLSLYMDPVAARLSMDDVVTRGQRTAFDTAAIRNLTPAPTGPRMED